MLSVTFDHDEENGIFYMAILKDGTEVQPSDLSEIERRSVEVSVDQFFRDLTVH